MRDTAYPDRVEVVEVGPRDGLQNERVILSVPTRVQLIKNLLAAGLKTIEAGSFVSPKWVPQMAGTAEVLSSLPQGEGISYPVLVPNLKGLDQARHAGAQTLAVFAAATEAFSKGAGAVCCGDTGGGRSWSSGSRLRVVRRPLSLRRLGRSGRGGTPCVGTNAPRLL
jgi:hypothetical protein